MRLGHASATWLVAGSLSLTGWAGPMPPYQQKAPYQTEAVVSVDPNQASKSEMEVELAWLADPLCFPCQLSAIHSGAVLEVGGVVPNDKIRQHVLAIAQKHSTLMVEDKLIIQPGSTLPVLSSNRDTLCRTAVTRMAKHFGHHGLTFDITADTAGQLRVVGSIPTAEEKLEVSRRLSQLPGCSAVINKLDVNPLAKNFQRPPAAEPTAARPAPADPAPVVTQVTLAAPKPLHTKPKPAAQPAPAAQVQPASRPMTPAPVSVKPPTVVQGVAPLSPYAQSSKPTPPATLGSPQPATPNNGWGPSPALAARPQPVQQQPQQRSDSVLATTARTPSSQPAPSPAATARTPSNPPAPGPAATAGMPSSGPQPAAMPSAVASNAQPLPPAQRSFVPGRPGMPPPAQGKSEVVAANLKAPAYAPPKSNVVPTGYQESSDVPRPMPRGPVQPAQPAAAVKPATQPLPPAPPARPMVQQVAAQTPPQSVAQPTAPKLRPTTPVPAYASARTEQASPYASRPQPAQRPAVPEVQPASASQPAPAAPESPRPKPVAQPVAPQPIQETATSAPVGARPMPTERQTGRPTSPDITPSFLTYIRQKVNQVSGGKARDVDLQKVGPDRLRIGLMVNTPQEGEQIASKILAIQELGPFQVDVEVRLAK